MSCMAKTNELLLRYKNTFKKLFPLFQFKRNILQLKQAYKDYKTLIQLIANKYGPLNFSSIVITENERENIELEFRINSILSIISQIRDCLKTNIIKVTDDKKKDITSKLAAPYSMYQSQYNILLSETIERPDVDGFNDFLRNRILHGGNMMFSTIWIKLPIDDNKYSIDVKITCDYGLLEESENLKKNVKENLHLYYTDTCVGILRLIIDHKLPISLLSDEQLKNINDDLKLKFDDKEIEFIKLTSNQINLLLNDKDFLLSAYNLWKERSIPSLGQFSFDLSTLIDNIYKSHIKLYEQLYQWVAYKNNGLIKELHTLHDNLQNLDYGLISISEKVNFGL